MDKNELIELINSLPDDVQIVNSDKDQYGCVDIKIFTEHKDNDFLHWYFGP